MSNEQPTSQPVNQPTKTKAGLFIKNILKPIIRGVVKSIPTIGTPIVELVTTLTTPKGQKRKHTNLSQIIQWAIAVAVILDIMLNKGANLLALIDFIRILPSGEVVEVSPAI